ncbi:MAG: hypothetical protein PWP23_1690 [Candidatus Sumerlaeota bacterium]|nr:hypothetical protein [Candidatus Sumerlaeota bacterium]
MRCLHTVTLALSLLALPAASLFAADEAINPSEWKPRTTSVSVFKDGTGFFLREGSVELNDGWAHTADIPPAAFGTLAIFSSTKGQKVDLVGAGPGARAVFDGIDRPDTLEARRGALADWINLHVAIEYGPADARKQVSGKLVEAGERHAIVEADTISAVPIGAIHAMQLEGMPLRVHVAGEDDAATGTSDLAMAFLRGGITWVPEYTMRLVDGRTAEIELRGVLLNEAEDLVHCDVNFVVGVPNFLHSNQLSPLASGVPFRAMGSSVLSQDMSNAFANSNYVQLPMEAQRQNTPGTATFPSVPNFGTEGPSDYTVYTVGDMTVRRGEKAMVSLFTARVPYSHAYTWSPSEGMKHFLKLENNSGTAWTTGSMLVLDGNRALTEDLLRYVPAGGDGRITVTSAVNVRASQSESEDTRELKAYSPNNNHEFFDRVVVAGCVELENYEGTAVEVDVTVPVQGRPLDIGESGSVQVDTTELRLTERRGSVSWTVTLQPGEEKLLHYQYERFVPSR